MAEVQTGYSPSTGKFFARLPGGSVQEITEEQAVQIRENPGVLSNIAGAAWETTKQIPLGIDAIVGNRSTEEQLRASQQNVAARGLISPVSTLVGQAVPNVAVDVAALAGGGIPLAIAAGAGMGAAQAPDEPFLGAAIGGAAGALPALPGMVGRVAGRLGEGGGAAAESLRSAAGALPPINARMTDRVLARMGGAEGATEQRVLTGYMSPEELQAAGIPFTRGDAEALLARNAGDMGNAQRIRNIEELQRSGPFGATTNTIRDQQKTNFTQYIKKELGYADDARALTDTRMGEVFTDLGKQFDEMRTAAGPSVRMGTKFRDDLKALVDNAEPDSQARLSKLVNGIIAKGGDTGPMTLSQRSIGDIERQLGKMVDVGINHGNHALLQDAMAIRMQIRQAIERQLPDAKKGEMQKLRKQYALASSLVRRGVRDPAGEVNIASLRNSWNLNPNYSKKQIGQEDLGRALETGAFLTSRVVPSSGTSERLMANAPNAALRAAPALGMTALGIDAVFRR